MNGYVSGGFRRVTKPCAKKMHNSGVVVYMCPKKLRPDSAWGYTGKIMPDDDFDEVVSEYEYYNCCTNKEGRCCSFYVSTEDDNEH